MIERLRTEVRSFFSVIKDHWIDIIYTEMTGSYASWTYTPGRNDLYREIGPGLSGSKRNRCHLNESGELYPVKYQDSGFGTGLVVPA